MPRCLVYGPKNIDVPSILAEKFPKAVITKFDGYGGVTAVFSENPEDTIKSLGLYVTTLDEKVSNVIKQAVLVRPAAGVPDKADERISELLLQRFNGRPMGEKGKFEIAIPAPDSKDQPDDLVRHRIEYELRMQAVNDIEDFMNQNGISVSIGLARW